MLRLVLLLPLVMLLPLMPAMADIHVNDPWIKEAPPGVRVMAGYLVLENQGSEPLVLTDVSSPVFERIELHLSVIENDVVRMEAQHAMALKPGDSVSFEPGGYHLMLYDPSEKLGAGEQVELQFGFADGRRLSVTAEVRRDTGGQDTHHHHHHHHH